VAKYENFLFSLLEAYFCLFLLLNIKNEYSLLGGNVIEKSYPIKDSF